MTLPTRPLGTEELPVSVIGLGCNNVGDSRRATGDLAGADRVIGAALDAGITLFDTAALYGGDESMSEQLIGQVFAGNGRRDEAVIATKWGHTAGPEPADWGLRGSRAFIRRAVDASLTRLRTDYLDLFQLHEPDPGTPIEETLGALHELIDAGKVRFIGHSNFSGEQVREADDAARAGEHPRFVSAQNHWSLTERAVEADVVPAAAERGLGIVPYFPLASGLLTGKYRQGDVPAGTRMAASPRLLDSVDWGQLEAYRQVCGEFEVPMLAASIGWLLAQPTVASVIAGATSVEQIHANAAAATVRLPDDLLAATSEIFAPLG